MTPIPEAGSLPEAISAVWRAECGVITGSLLRLTRDLGLAEECAQDALLSALQHWPTSGLPTNPGAWLMTTARNRALDMLRQRQMQARQHEALGQDLIAQQAAVVPDFVDTLDERRPGAVADDLLRLIFTACHPLLPPDAQVALTLRLLVGLSTAEIARAFLTGEATIAQRIVRAKKTLGAAAPGFELPRGPALAQRLGAVLQVLYLLFNEGYAASAGEHPLRPALCDEALRLGRLLAGMETLAHAEPEVAGLLALMELQASRSAARVDAAGAPVRLADQDRRLWDALQIRRGLAALDRAEAAAHAAGRGPGRYALQAGIAACHARAASVAATDWPRIVAHYDTLLLMDPQPVVALNRAVAVAQAQGPVAALALVDALAQDARLQHYPWLPAVQGDLLDRLGRTEEAAAALERAAALSANQAEQAHWRARAAALLAAIG